MGVRASTDWAQGSCATNADVAEASPAGSID